MRLSCSILTDKHIHICLSIYFHIGKYRIIIYSYFPHRHKLTSPLYAELFQFLRHRPQHIHGFFQGISGVFRSG